MTTVLSPNTAGLLNPMPSRKTCGGAVKPLPSAFILPPTFNRLIVGPAGRPTSFEPPLSTTRAPHCQTLVITKNDPAGAAAIVVCSWSGGTDFHRLSGLIRTGWPSDLYTLTLSNVHG